MEGPQATMRERANEISSDRAGCISHLLGSSWCTNDCPFGVIAGLFKFGLQTSDIRVIAINARFECNLGALKFSFSAS